MSQRDTKSLEIVLPQDIYASCLKVVNGVPFTRREIEIISCVLSGRSAKKIASFLSISPKTVENHIRNVMLKLGCNSQEGIRDFIEKSGKFAQVKKYYSSLLVQGNFELQLNKISVLTAKNRPSCIIIYDSEQTEEIPLLNQLQRHLNLAGIKTTMEVRERYQSTNSFTDKIESQQANYVIFNLSSAFIEQPKTNNDIGDSPVINPFQTNNKNTDSIIILLLDKINSLKKPREFLGSNYIDLAELGNYYFLVFETLKKLLPNIIINKNIAEFKLHHSMLNNSSDDQAWLQETRLTPHDKTEMNFLEKLKNRKIQTFLGILFFLAFVFTLNFIFNENAIRNKAMQLLTRKPTNINTPKTFSLLQQLELEGAASWNLPRQDNVFIGREKLLDELHAKLTWNKNLKNSSNGSNNNKILINPLAISACAGLGGIGKTQLALQYAHHTKYPYILKTWFPAENLEQFRLKYMEFSKELGYIENKLNIENAVIYVNNWLLHHPGWLLIYDNVNNYEEISPFLPESGGHVVLTTRNRSWPEKFEILPVDVMTEDEAINLIKSLTFNNIREDQTKESKELVKLLGYLPLALSQAGSYIRQNQITISNYLELYKIHENELLSDKTVLEGTPNIPVAVTWNITLSELAKKAKEPFFALHLLTICSYLSPENISQDLLLALLKESYPNLDAPELVLSRAIGQLWKYSLINSSENKEITIHRLMQVVLRSQHKQALTVKNNDYPPLTQDWYNSLLKGIYKEFIRPSQPLEERVRKLNLFPHLQSLKNHHTLLWPECDSSDFGRVLRSIGFCYHLLGDYRAAKLYAENSLKIFSKDYEKNRSDITKSLNNIGFCSMEMGETKEAKYFLERSLQIKEKMYGKNNPKNALTLSNLGGAYRDLGSLNEAKNLLELALTMLNEPYEIALTLTRLGDVYGDLNDTKKRKNVLQKALEILENHYGKDDPEVGKTLVSLSESYGNLGEYQQQKLLLERALKINEQYYGKNHPETARALTKLGNSYMALGNIKQGKEFLEMALKIKEQNYGINHLEIAKTLNNLGDAYRELGDVHQAKKSHEKTLDIRIKYYGENHPEVAKTLNSLGYDYGFLGNAKVQKELSERALQIQEKYYGKDHPEIASAISNLGYAYRALGNAEYSKILQERALEIKKLHFGENHPETAKIMASLGDIHGDLGEIKQKKFLLEQALKIEEKHYGSEHPITAKILTSLGDAHRMLGDRKYARKLLERALKIREKYYGIDHPEVAKTLIALGDTYQDLGNIKHAKKLYERTLRIRELYYGTEHPEVSKVLTTLGGTYLSLKEPEQANKLLINSLKIKENFYGLHHPEVAKTLLKLVQLYISTNRHTEAKLLSERCYSIFSKAYGEENSYTKQILDIRKNELNTVDI